MTRTQYPTSLDLQRLLLSARLITLPYTIDQDLIDYKGAIDSAVTEWERATGWVPFFSSGTVTTRDYDPPGPQKGPIGIYAGVANVGGSRRLFLDSGLQSVTSVYVGVTRNKSTLAGSVAGTVTTGAFVGTFTGSLTPGTGTFTGVGTATITDGMNVGTFSFTIAGAGTGTFNITGTVTGSATGAVTGTASLTGIFQSAGTLLTQDIEYWLSPRNADAYNRPFTAIEFAYPQWGNPRSILVTGPFGFCSAIPEDAWTAILKQSGLILVPTLQTAQFSGLLKWTDADVSETYREKPFQAVMDDWQTQTMKVQRRYTRKVIV